MQPKNLSKVNTAINIIVHSEQAVLIRCEIRLTLVERFWDRDSSKIQNNFKGIPFGPIWNSDIDSSISVFSGYRLHFQDIIYK